MATGCRAELGCPWEEWHKTGDLPKRSPPNGAQHPRLLPCRAEGQPGGVPGGDVPWVGGDGNPSFPQAKGRCCSVLHRLAGVRRPGPAAKGTS